MPVCRRFKSPTTCHICANVLQKDNEVWSECFHVTCRVCALKHYAGSRVCLMGCGTEQSDEFLAELFPPEESSDDEPPILPFNCSKCGGLKQYAAQRCKKPCVGGHE